MTRCTPNKNMASCSFGLDAIFMGLFEGHVFLVTLAGNLCLFSHVLAKDVGCRSSALHDGCRALKASCLSCTAVHTCSPVLLRTCLDTCVHCYIDVFISPCRLFCYLFVYGAVIGFVNVELWSNITFGWIAT